MTAGKSVAGKFSRVIPVAPVRAGRGMHLADDPGQVARSGRWTIATAGPESADDRRRRSRPVTMAPKASRNLSTGIRSAASSQAGVLKRDDGRQRWLIYMPMEAAISPERRHPHDVRLVRLRSAAALPRPLRSVVSLLVSTFPPAPPACSSATTSGWPRRPSSRPPCVESFALPALRALSSSAMISSAARETPSA